MATKNVAVCGNQEWLLFWLIEAEWRIYDLVIIGSGNGLSPVRRQAIT